MKQDVYLAALRARRKKRAQSLTEFALILPILLFLTMGIIDFGRVLFTYAQASAQLRSALRLASVVGFSSNVYLDCYKMRTIASTNFFTQSNSVTITYIDYDASPVLTYPTDGNCDGNPNDLSAGQRTAISNGDILRISNNVSVAMMTPFFPSPLTFTIAGQRTLVTSVSLLDAPYAGSTSLALTQTENYAIFATQLAGATQTAVQETAVVASGQTATAAQVMTNDIASSATLSWMLTQGIDTPTHTATPDVTPNPTNTPVLPQVQNLRFWSGGARCTGASYRQYPGLIWDRVPGVQGYYIYADGVLVGKTTDKLGAIRQCGRSLKSNRAGRISGCFNLSQTTWNPDDTDGILYQVAAYKANGAVIGPLSTAVNVIC